MDFKKLFFITFLCVAVESVLIGAVVLHIIVLRSDSNWLMEELQVSVSSTNDVIVNDDVRPADERVEERGDFNWPIEERPWLSVPTTIGLNTDRLANSGERVEEQRGHAGLTWPTEERPGLLKAVLQKAATVDIGTNKPADEGVEEHFRKLQVYDVQVDRSHAHFIPPKLWHTSHTVEDVAVQNVDKCLTATKLTNYFSAQGYLHHAHSNAQHLLTALKELIPSKFIDRFNDHCWNVTTDLYHSHPAMLQLYPSENKTNTSLQRTAKFNALSSPNPQACLPRMFLLGFNKCGSTFLYSMITTHSFIARPIKKEPKWWFMAPLTTSSNIADLLVDYLKNFMPLMERIAKGESNLVTIDGTPGNLCKWPGYRYKIITDICLLPSIIPEILPKSKFLVVMRNPVTMLYSTFWYSCTKNNHMFIISKSEILKGPDIFHRRVVAKIKQFNSCFQYLPLTKCAYDTVTNANEDKLLQCGHIRINEALYFIHIQKWLSIVPRDRFLFLTLDELSENTNTVMERVWQFIGIPSSNSYRKMSHTNRNYQETVEYHSDPRLMMRNDTKQLLQDFFRPFNRILSELLQDSKFLWENSTV